MMRKQFPEEQIIGILKEAEAGGLVTELCRKHGKASAGLKDLLSKAVTPAASDKRSFISRRHWE
jgi:putative transposase